MDSIILHLLSLLLLYVCCWIHFNCSSISALRTSSSLSTDGTHLDLLSSAPSSSLDYSILNLLNKSCKALDDCTNSNNSNNNQTTIMTKESMKIPFIHCNKHYGRCACNQGYRPSIQIENGFFSCIRITTPAENNNDFSGTKNDDDDGGNNNAQKMANKTILPAKSINSNYNKIGNNSKNNVFQNLVYKSPMLPVLVVLISMFICMCIVLQLFAKARFRNANQSIFVNPQKLELAKAQERRMSQLSQLSGIPGYGFHRLPTRSNMDHYTNNHQYNSNNNKTLRQYQPYHGRSLPSISMMGTRSTRSSIASNNTMMAGYPSFHLDSSGAGGKNSHGNTAIFVNNPTKSFDHFCNGTDSRNSSSIVMKAKSRSNSISSSKLFGEFHA